MEPESTAIQHPLRCPSCENQTVVLRYSTPVYVLTTNGVVTRVVVSDEESEFAGSAWCRRCGERWDLQAEPDLGTWPAWEVGW